MPASVRSGLITATNLFSCGDTKSNQDYFGLDPRTPTRTGSRFRPWAATRWFMRSKWNEGLRFAFPGTIYTGGERMTKYLVIGMIVMSSLSVAVAQNSAPRQIPNRAPQRSRPRIRRRRLIRPPAETASLWRRRNRALRRPAIAVFPASPRTRTASGVAWPAKAGLQLTSASTTRETSFRNEGLSFQRTYT